jgi:hypothetical protein
MADVPAFVQNGRLDVLATNALGRAFYCDLFDGDDVRGGAGRPPNHARYTFLDSRSVDFYPNWELAARTGVALLRAETGRRPDDRVLTELIGELTSRSDRFSTLWAAHDVRRHTAGTKRFHHRMVGDLELDYETLDLPGDEGLALTTYSAPPGSTSQQALRFLASWTAAPEQVTSPESENQSS